MTVMKRALTIARFQPLHLDHYRAIQRMKEDGYEEVIIGLGSAECSYTMRNPFECRERIEMVHSVLKDEGFKHYFIIPIRDIGDNDLWATHVVRLVPEFEMLYSTNPLVIRLFKNLGYRVVDDVLAVEGSNRISGAMIREMIARGDEKWKELVPRQVYEKILEFDCVERIKELYSAL